MTSMQQRFGDLETLCKDMISEMTKLNEKVSNSTDNHRSTTRELLKHLQNQETPTLCTLPPQVAFKPWQNPTLSRQIVTASASSFPEQFLKFYINTKELQTETVDSLCKSVLSINQERAVLVIGSIVMDCLIIWHSSRILTRSVYYQSDSLLRAKILI